MIFFVAILLGLTGMSCVSATGESPLSGTTPPARTITNLNAGWRYLENNASELAEANAADDWLQINLPHTWNQWDAMDPIPGYRRDASWYQKDISVNGPANARYLLYFEGSNITTEVYVDGTKAGGHVGGYVGFDVDITDYVTPGSTNTVSIRVDNSYNPNVIPSQKADFFIYGGITRDLWLKVLPKTHLSDIRVSTPEVTAAAATTSVIVEVGEGVIISEKQTIACTIRDVKGDVVAKKQFKASVLAASNVLALPIVKNPALWSPDSPNLYTVRVRLMDGKDVVDEMTEIIGYRFYRFEPYGAFFLNGERLLLRGTHRHEEHAGYGAAMPNELHVRDMKMMKEMGVNFLRLGHYPQDPEIYRMADELGIVLWDELPWCRGGMGGKLWRANTERLFRQQIRQNFNHPSIFFWSVGNEIYWLPDFEDGDDEDALNNYVSKLNNIAKEEDPYRLTAIRKYYAGADRIDVFSPSIWSGWYAGVYTNYQATLKKNQKLYKQFLHMEYGGSSHVGRHTENPITGTGLLNEDDWAEVANQVNVQNIAKSGDWTESYIVDLFDHHLSVTETEPNFTGNAQWAFKDFGTPLRPQNAIPYLNQKGLVDRDGKPKDAFYVYKSYWGKEPFAYIESHTWTHRRGPEGKVRNVPVFSNCDEVELVQAGKSLGRKTKTLGELPAQGLNWDVQFKAGANHLKAKAFKGGKLVVTDTLTVFYDFQQSGKPDEIHLSYANLPNGNMLVEAIMKDKNGLRVYDYEEELYFALDGQGELMKYYGTPTGSDIIQMANGRAAIELVPEKNGRAIIEARNQDFKGSYIVINFNSARK
jgi:beta-galactosidase